MTDNLQNSKRIAKNTLFLYIRMAILMIISIYTSRVVLDKLGIEDYGIYNVVGGVAAMLTFFSSSLTNASQRFFSIELGKGNLRMANQVFNQHLLLYALIIGGVILIAETIGLWFVYNKLVFPPERISAVIWIYQFAIVSLCFTLLGIVFHSSIIAHENMGVFSLLGIFEGISRLVIVYMLNIFQIDKLILYSFLMFLITLLLQVFYMIYSFKHYQECKLRFVWDKNLLRETNSIVGWNLVGTAVSAINDTGINILLNLFFGPVVNAARAISCQVSGAVNNFANNFFISIHPQLTKSYASRDYGYMMSLFYNSSKYSFFMLWIFCLPITFACKELMKLWLVEVPQYADVFTVLVLGVSLVNSLNNPIWAITLATGRLKRYMIIGNGIFLLIFPVSYIALKLGYSPIVVFIIMLIDRVIYLYAVLHIVKTYIPLTRKEYIKRVIIPCVKVLLVSSVACYVLYKSMPVLSFWVLLYCVLSAFIILGCIWILGISNNERAIIYNFVNNKLKKCKLENIV